MAGSAAEFDDGGLYYKKAKLLLPFKCVTEEYNAGKARLGRMLRESVAPTVRKIIEGSEQEGCGKRAVLSILHRSL